MPIVGLSDRRRLPRLLKVRLGTKATNQRGAQYPKEVDHFVFERTSVEGVDQSFLAYEREVAKGVTALYGAAPKALRMMLPLEVDAVDPQTDDAIILDTHNRAYGRNAGLKCKGTGLSPEDPGTAETSDEAWAKRIAGVTGAKPEKTKSGRFAVTCWGRGCPKFATGGDEHDGVERDPDAACRSVGILRAFLLHPSTDPSSSDYCKVIGVVEIATGSWNSIVDVQSGLAMLRAFSGGRTAALPFTLLRTPRYTYKGGKKLHFPMTITFDPEEVGRFGMTPPSQVFLAPSVRAELTALAAAGSDVDFDTVRDLVPARVHPRLTEPGGPMDAAPETLGPGPVSTDREEALEAAGADDAPTPEIGHELVQLSQAERNELREAINDSERFRELARAAHREYGTDPDGPQPITRLQKRHGAYIREQLAEAQAEVDPDDLPTTRAAG